MPGRCWNSWLAQLPFPHRWCDAGTGHSLTAVLLFTRIQVLHLRKRIAALQGESSSSSLSPSSRAPGTGLITEFTEMHAFVLRSWTFGLFLTVWRPRNGLASACSRCASVGVGQSWLSCTPTSVHARRKWAIVFADRRHPQEEHHGASFRPFHTRARLLVAPGRAKLGRECVCGRNVFLSCPSALG